MRRFRLLLPLLAALFAAVAAWPALAATTGGFSGASLTPNSSGSVRGWLCQAGGSAPSNLTLLVDASGANNTSSFSLSSNLNTGITVAQQPNPTSGGSDCTSGTEWAVTASIDYQTEFRFGGLPLWIRADYASGPSSNVLVGALPQINPLSASESESDCHIQNLNAASDPNSLAHCLGNIATASNAAGYNTLILDNDLTCSVNSASGCCPDNIATPMISLTSDSGHGYEINGQGHTIHRLGDPPSGQLSGQSKCPVLTLSGISNVLVTNLRIDDDQTAPLCGLQPCQPAVNVSPYSLYNGTVNGTGAPDTNIKFDQVGIYYAKQMGIMVDHTNGFVFSRSVISTAGEMGLFIGLTNTSHDGPSYNVVIADSVFSWNQVNAVVLTEVNNVPTPVPTSFTDATYTMDPITIASVPANGSTPIRPATIVSNGALVLNNIFVRNQWFGTYRISSNTGSYNPETYWGGGQLYTPNVHGLFVENNVFADGECFDCNTPLAVFGMEIGTGGGAAFGVYNLMVDRNYAYNGVNLAKLADGVSAAFFQNIDSEVGSDTPYNSTVPTGNSFTVSNNQVYGFQAVDNLTTAYVSPSEIASAPSNQATPPNNSVASLNRQGKAAYQIIELATGYGHRSVTVQSDYSGTLQAVYGLSSTARVAGPMTPLYRCFVPVPAGAAINYQTTQDFITTHRDCHITYTPAGASAPTDVYGSLHSIVGFSYAASDAGSVADPEVPIFGCTTPNGDYFVQKQSCTGATTYDTLGYALVLSAPLALDIQKPIGTTSPDQ